MKNAITKETGKPAYLQLYEKIRSDIIDGIYPIKTKLPSKRTMAENSGFSTITVEHAYALLCDEGYVEARERSGYFVCFTTDDVFARPSVNLPASHIHTGKHEPVAEEFPFSVLAKTMRTVISAYSEGILAKAPNSGCSELKEAIRLYLARSRGITADTRQIIIGSGSEYLYSLIVELLGREKTYGIESPSYKKIEQVYTASDVTVKKLSLGHDGIDSTELWKCSADVLHISPYRSYPSGVTATASKRHEYIRWANEGRRIIVEDDFESEFSLSRKPEETLFSISKNNNVIYMNTFSRTLSPSLRVGYMVLPKNLVDIFDEKLGFYSCTVPTYIQLVLAELISSGDFERHINRVRRRNRRNVGQGK